jgi:precorrin-6B methylase 2
MPCNADAGEFALSLSRVMIAASLGPRPEARHVAIVGLGGGMIPLWFQQQRPSVHVDAIDISNGVVQAVHCFGIRNSTTMNVVNEDGRAFLQQQSKQKYDAVLLDAFDDQDNIPSCLRTIEFFRMIKSRLVSDGGLVINTWRKNLDVMLPALEQVFGTVLVCKSPGLGNIIVHATSSSLKVPTMTQEPDNSFFGKNFFKHKPKASQEKAMNGGPAEWLAKLEFIHPPKGWVMYPQYHRDQGSNPTAVTAPPPLTPTSKPLLTEYQTPDAETDLSNQCPYPAD